MCNIFKRHDKKLLEELKKEFEDVEYDLAHDLNETAAFSMCAPMGVKKCIDIINKKLEEN